jgi:RND family efflux transporter MFP subunit
VKRILDGGNLFRAFVPFCIVSAGGAIADAQENPAAVVVTPVIEREVKGGHRAVGTIMPLRRSTVGSAVDGRVIEYLIDLGDPVKQGQPLARLRTATLEIELAAAKAELKLRQEELAEIKNGSRPEEITEAKARMLAAQAVMQNSATKLTRMTSLFERKAINEVDLDDARERSEAAHQTFLATEAIWKRIHLGPRQEQIEQALARVQLQQEQVRLIEDRILKFTILAPFDGFVSAEHTEVGEWISEGDPVAVIIQLDEVEVLSHVPAEHAVQLRRGLDVRIELPELPGELFTGRVERVVPAADVRTRTFPVSIRLKNRVSGDRPLLMAGMLARANLPTGAKRQMPLIPKDALVLTGSRRFVFVLELDAAAKDRGSVRRVPVNLGVADGAFIQIDAPLHAGELVVVRGNERLQDGQRVRISRMMTHKSNEPGR